MNYSSAKSIFHTYRKEGRIVKKTIKTRVKKHKNQPVSQPPQVVDNSSWASWMGGFSLPFTNSNTANSLSACGKDSAAISNASCSTSVNMSQAQPLGYNNSWNLDYFNISSVLSSLRNLAPLTQNIVADTVIPQLNYTFASTTPTTNQIANPTIEDKSSFNLFNNFGIMLLLT